MKKHNLKGFVWNDDIYPEYYLSCNATREEQDKARDRGENVRSNMNLLIEKEMLTVLHLTRSFLHITVVDEQVLGNMINLSYHDFVKFITRMSQDEK